jgi:protein-S-isoprenylcysteine O-methyltransferase Ste14
MVRKKTKTNNDAKTIKRYDKLERPIWRLIALSTLLLILVCLPIAVCAPALPYFPAGTRADRITFLAYLCIFIANWWVYFSSKRKQTSNGPTGAQTDRGIQSLRRLLQETSINWNYNPQHEEAETIKEAFHRKASTTMEVIAILIAVSVLILDIASNLWTSNKVFDPWQQYSMGLAALLAIIAFASFLISVDSLDTMFNRFVSTPVRNVIVHYFYHNTINPKYFGMVSMILAVVLLLQVYNSMLASMSFAFILVIGYSQWYPNLRRTLCAFNLEKKPPKHKSDCGPPIFAGIVKFVFIATPAMIHYFYPQA